MNAQHVTIDLINMVFVGGTHSEVEQFHNTQPSTDTTNEKPLLKRDFWVAQNLNNKGRVYGSEGLVMRQQSQRSTSARS